MLSMLLFGSSIRNSSSSVLKPVHDDVQQPSQLLDNKLPTL
jgi:hypothetical protein